MSSLRAVFLLASALLFLGCLGGTTYDPSNVEAILADLEEFEVGTEGRPAQGLDVCVCQEDVEDYAFAGTDEICIEDNYYDIEKCFDANLEANRGSCLFRVHRCPRYDSDRFTTTPAGPDCAYGDCTYGEGSTYTWCTWAGECKDGRTIEYCGEFPNPIDPQDIAGLIFNYGCWMEVEGQLVAGSEGGCDQGRHYTNEDAMEACEVLEEEEDGQGSSVGDQCTSQELCPGTNIQACASASGDCWYEVNGRTYSCDAGCDCQGAATDIVENEC
jgi:hypothetical protein